MAERMKYIAYTSRYELDDDTGWTIINGWAFRFFSHEDDAINFKLSGKDIKLIDNSSGYLSEPFGDSIVLNEEAQHLFNSGVKLSGENHRIVLGLVTADRWTTEDEIAEVVSLTPYQWRRLQMDEAFKTSKRKRGLVYKLSREGERMKDALERRERRERQMVEREAERAKRKADHEAFMAGVDEALGKLGIKIDE